MDQNESNITDDTESTKTSSAGKASLKRRLFFGAGAMVVGGGLLGLMGAHASGSPHGWDSRSRWHGRFRSRKAFKELGLSDDQRDLIRVAVGRIRDWAEMRRGEFFGRSEEIAAAVETGDVRGKLQAVLRDEIRKAEDSLEGPISEIATVMDSMSDEQRQKLAVYLREGAAKMKKRRNFS